MQLPEHRKNVFLYLCAFLQEVLCHISDNGLDTKTVGEADTFIRYATLNVII
jgi:phosphatidylinositol-bisphosphatase